ncbi:MAG TPA: Hsp20/alpha crystallin family protein [Candidatus Pacearchaeota archaeon]|nr:Hsp20/alpha crystallin family protein [Candidatus Pacearchaeota archaeon]
MSLIPFKQIFDDELIKSFEETPNSFKMNLYETEKDIIAEVEAPGFSLKDIDIEVGDTSLKIEAKKKEEKEERGKGYFRKELNSGYFKRVIILPDVVQKEKVKADYSEGIVKIIMPKIKKKGTTKIKIK